MDEPADPRFKRERHVAYGQSPLLHMPPADAPQLHNYHHPTPQGTQMPQAWNRAPLPYYDPSDHRPPPTDAPPPHHPSYPPFLNSHPPPPPPPSQTPTYTLDPTYSRQNSASDPPRSPFSVPPPHYPQAVNGAPPLDNYYYRQHYGNRPAYAPSESPVNAPQSAVHVRTTSHAMMPGQPQAQEPAPGYLPVLHSAGPPPTPHDWGPPPGGRYQQQRRKSVRAAQACDSCRQRKAKCDEGRPECTHCRENGLWCTYRDVPPQKSEGQMLQMSEKVGQLSDRLDSYIKSADDKVNILLNTVQSLVDRRTVETKSPGSVPMSKTASRPHTKEEASSDHLVHFRGHETVNAGFIQNSRFAVDQTHSTEGSSPNEKKKRKRVSASALLEWPAISELVPKDIPASYVLEGEAKRGLLRLYGCGEGDGKGDGHEGAVASAAASSCSGRVDEEASTSSPSGVWGTGPLPYGEDNQRAVYDCPGGVTANGELLLDKEAVDTYVKSYLGRMYILHPFLDKKVLRKMVNVFKKKYSWDDNNNANPLAQSVGVGTKRKRESSQSPHSTRGDLHTIPHHNSVRQRVRSNPPVEHSVSNAIVLLVMALGQICAYDKPLPGPAKSSSIAPNGKTTVQQPQLGYSDLPPLGRPPSSAPQSPSIPHINGLSMGLAGSSLRGKNIGVIPGLAYFAKAAGILGELPGGVDVSHVQANLLAGLYMGQLARVIPSHWYIANACRACMILIESSEFKEKKMSRERRNLINFAFWSCLQLESDILAEVDLPPSGIVATEGAMAFEIPDDFTVADPEAEGYVPGTKDPTADHYSNQIQLRRTINDAVNHIYNSSRESEKPSEAIISTITEILESWRELTRERLDWDWEEDEFESTDINLARMRGKYYGAKYLINRPALQYALNLAGPGTPMSQTSESPIGGGAQSEHTFPPMNYHGDPPSSRKVGETRPPAQAAEQPLEPWILDACTQCIDAAIKSTTAFDKVPGRLVITNILGTAHAQFGNVLVLAATFNSPDPRLRSLVSEEKLRELLTRTIGFLDDKASVSPALGKDAQILRHVQNELFPRRNVTTFYPSSANSSFSCHR
ncbi:hypothetical protein PMZ80_011160 [Knufia obscura]|uniref:Zn(2)-C6 fungal-type domain-containing protein n=2 Tax=Trichomeriaceae TaxID=1233474 RepID=A0ABR0K2H6_9EURO|nr:hypothetical protein LTR24_008227 [Lithohypha guttulata]KAK5936595.1 hypothetical protein PMZ80_011160 [Knufia obscura]